MANEQIALSFGKGVTNVPSDALCDDNELEECKGLCFEDGEYRVVQKPSTFMTGLTIAQSLLYIHKLSSEDDCYIIREGDNIKWGKREKSGDDYVYSPAKSGGSDIVLVSVSGGVKVTSVGKTLVIADERGLYYFRWDGSGYKQVTWPVQNFSFSAKMVSDGTIAASTGNPEGIIDIDSDSQDSSIASQKQEDFNNLVVGLYEENIKKITRLKMFAKPFFVRAALEMYDGSYTNITTPILLFPSVDENTRYFMYVLDVFGVLTAKKLVAVTQMLSLFVCQSASLEDYTDIIKDVVVFASRGIDIYKLSQDQEIANGTGNNIGYSISSIFDGSVGPSVYRAETHSPEAISGLALSDKRLRCLAHRESKAICDDITSEGQFYKIASLGLKGTSGYVDISAYTTSEILENLETQDRLPYDDYYSRNSLIPKYISAYNSRLTLANVSRGLFSGFTYFMPLDDPSNLYYYTFDVTISTDSGDVTVRATDYTNQKQGIYFYYPDARAKHVRIYKNVGGNIYKILDEDLKEHPFLNGAYYFSWPSGVIDEPAGTADSLPANPPGKEEILYNMVIQSEVNNPWLFLSSGYRSVGFARILGISTVTQALSQGQFGTYPLIVFTEDGVWAIGVERTGVYGDVYPMSREVCNNPRSITQTDDAVFFTSKKGLMRVFGAQVSCVSNQLSGKMRGSTGLYAHDFNSFLEGCFIAYDYRDSLLWLFSTEHAATCWLYSVKTGTFSTFDFDKAVGNVVGVVNNYPDFLLQCNTETLVFVLSLIGREDINSDSTDYSARIVTRPMKFNNALSLKSIRQIHNVSDMVGTMEFSLKASNDLKTWVTMNSLRGLPWKYYRLTLTFTGMKATDRFTGTVVVTQERRTNKLR